MSNKIIPNDDIFKFHENGKISIIAQSPIRNNDDLSIAYTPGVGRVSMEIHNNPSKVWDYTIRNNSVAVISDGTAVLGLGDIGPEAAMPVMEGKALLFKQFGHIDAWPICLDTKDTELIIQTVKLLAPSFGGINLEDISAPRCFIIEDRLKNEMDIPVMHDDQHGTAVVVLAALINACKITNKPINKSKIVILGAGAASSACAKILIESGAEQIILLDRQGILHKQRSFEDNPMKHWLAQHTNPSNLSGSLDDALRNADIFLGMSGPNLITRDQILTMSPNPIIFALSNPDPEILPSEIDDIASIIATGRSDFPNQVNNALCFPGIFRGALNVRATIINEEMKLAAAQAIASYIPDHSLNKNYIIPNIFELGVAEAVAEATMKAATSSGVARVSPINTK